MDPIYGTPIHVLIATPAHDQKVSTVYLQSIFALQKLVSQRQLPIEISLKVVSYAIIDMARNYLATLVWEDKKYTHLLFIDADQGFDPEMIIEMIALKKLIVSAIICARKMNMDSIWRWARKTDSPDRLLSLSSSFILPEILRNDAGEIELTNGFVQVSSAGTGLMLVERSVLERLAEFPDMVGQGFAPLVQEGYSGRILQCFRPIVTDQNIPLGEDLSFSKRWKELCGGEIWSNITYDITHVGPFAFKARLLDRLLFASPVEPMPDQA